MSKTSPFTYLNSINDTKFDLSEDSDQFKSYTPFVVNRSLSYFYDTAQLANLMNVNHHLDSKSQYLFLLNTVRKRKRFSKWIKPDEEKNVDLVKEYYGYSSVKARQVLSLLTEDQLKAIKITLSKGGRV